MDAQVKLKEASRSLRVLVVEDDAPSARALCAILTHFGHEFTLARDGVEAVELFASWAPELVLMDIMMPRMDGYEATRRIKAACGEKFVPVIFVTALNDNTSLCKAIEAGGDDYLTKPYQLEEIGAKIAAMQRIMALHEELLRHKLQAERHQIQQQKELHVAEHLFKHILERGEDRLAGVEHWVSSAAVFCGDIILVSETPQGSIQMLVGDFAGHGITAAIGAMPAAETFYGMSAKGFALERILEELNQKLYRVLPADIFCAAVALEIDPERKALRLWNGAMPMVYVLDHDTGEMTGLPSQHLALGVQPADRFSTDTEVIPLTGKESVYVFSDGLVRAESLDGEKLGSERLECFLVENAGGAVGIDALKALVEGHIGDNQQLDDISILTVDTSRLERRGRGQRTESADVSAPTNWRFSLELEADSLRRVNPVPLVMNLIQEIQGLAPFRQHIFSILSELFANALDHGLLELDSAIKADGEGFMRFYELKKARLAALREGRLGLTLSHRAEDGEGVLEVRVEDSGAGFDVNALRPHLEDNDGYSGRGLSLVRARCETLEFNERGNVVTARYRWQPGMTRIEEAAGAEEVAAEPGAPETI